MTSRPPGLKEAGPATESSGGAGEVAVATEAVETWPLVVPRLPT